MKREKIGNLLLKFRRGVKIPADQYLDHGDTPVIDQSTSSWIAGYTNNPEARHESPLPITVFGDHTRVVKFVNFPFASGADGTQLLYPNTGRIDPTYFYYAIRNVDLSNYFYARHFKFLKEEEIGIPSLERQQAIAEILSAYDNLIENNRRRIALLEESARLLYREWFVRLRFPGHEHTRIVNSVPEGWRNLKLGDICTDNREMVSPESLEPDTPYIGLEHMPRRSISLSDWGTAEQVTSSKLRFHTGDILFGKIRPYFHKVGIAFTDGIVSSDAFVIRPTAEALKSVVLMTVSSDEFIANASQAMKEGSKMPRADWKQMVQYPVLLPPEGLLADFSETITSITDQLRNLSTQNQKLRTARDLLLPKLMSGEIEV